MLLLLLLLLLTANFDDKELLLAVGVDESFGELDAPRDRALLTKGARDDVELSKLIVFIVKFEGLLLPDICIFGLY
jgi:hypothetical protein